MSFLRDQCGGLGRGTPQFTDLRVAHNSLQRGVDLRVEKARAANGPSNLGQQELSLGKMQMVSNLGDQRSQVLPGAKHNSLRGSFASIRCEGHHWKYRWVYVVRHGSCAMLHHRPFRATKLCQDLPGQHGV